MGNKIVLFFRYEVRYLLLLVFLISNFTCFGQGFKSKVDSLTVLVAKTQNDSLKCALYIDIAYEYLSTDIVKRDEYVAKAVKVLQKVNAKKLAIRLDLLRAYIHLLEGKNEQVISEIEKIQKRLKSYYYEDLYLNSIYIESMALNYKGQIDKSIQLLSATLQKIPDSRHPKDLARIYFSLGQSYGFKYDISNAIKYMKKAIEYYKKAKFDSGVFTCYNEICYGYMRIGNYDKALYYSNQLKSYANAESTKYTQYITNGQLYFYLKKYDQAIDFLKKGLEINTKLKDDINRPLILVFLVKCYVEKKDTNNLFLICRSKVSSGATSFKQQFVFDYGLASAYFINKNYKEANRYVDSINARLEKGADAWITEDEFIILYKLTAEVKSVLGDFKQAYQYQRKYIERYKSYEENLKSQNALQLQDELDSYVKDNKISELTVTKQKNKIEIQRQQYYKLIYGIAAIFLGIISIIVIWFYRKIRIKNKIISDNADTILLQNNEIKENLAVKELLLKEIHHRVKNNLQIVMNLLKIQARESTLNSIEDFVKKGQARILTISLIHENLYSHEQLDKIDLKKYLVDLVHNLKSFVDFDQQDIEINMTIDEIYFDIQNAVPLGLIINELLTNSFKHAFKNVQNGQINITLKQTLDNNYELTYSDSGPGFVIEEKNSKSLGVDLIYQLTKQLHGTIHKDATQSSKFVITLNQDF